MKTNSDRIVEKIELVDQVRKEITKMIGYTQVGNDNMEMSHFLKLKQELAKLEILMLYPNDHLGTEPQNIQPDEIARKPKTTYSYSKQNGTESGNTPSSY